MKKQKLLKQLRIGSVAQKILVLLGTGLALGLSRRPDQYFRVIKSAAKEWDAIGQRSLHDAIRNLYQSKLVDWKENKDGTISMILTESGAQRTLCYNLKTLHIKSPERWDEQWRIVISDIPEHKKKARNAFAATLKRVGFHPMQKSVFIHPYPCDDEMDFIIEAFGLRRFVRLITAQDVDIDVELRHKFNLPSAES